ncbi:MAG: CRISPR-associated endonuclease Cas1 [Lentisphaeria bacterium]|nr:CRISPR-associated endonuclease Cas1 [Lentisphaeria bacterium]
MNQEGETKMEVLELRNQRSRLSVREGQLVISDDGGVISRHPICATEMVQVYGNPQITTQAVKECLKEGVRVNYYNVYGKYLGRVEPGYPKNTQRRLEQYRVYLTPELRLAWSREIVRAKIQSEKVEVRRLQEQGYAEKSPSIRKELEEGLSRAAQAENVANLLGIEGNCARIYYEAFRSALPEGVTWNGRSHHPAEDGLNAAMSWAYGITAMEIRSAIERHALDPHCGILHEPGYGSGGLTYDLMEPIRANFCDHVLLRLIRKDRSLRKEIRNAGDGTLSEAAKTTIATKLRESMEEKRWNQKYNMRELIGEMARGMVSALNTPGQPPSWSEMLPAR